MDRVRFGRALGGGAREAAKALVKAAEAASAPSPAGRRAGEVVGRVAGHAAVRVEQAKTSTAAVQRGGKRFGEAVWGPLVKQSGVLWLEFTGVFFGLFAVSAGVGVWKSRGELLGAGAARERAWFAVAMLVVFGYFTVSSFVRARQRGRR